MGNGSSNGDGNGNGKGNGDGHSNHDNDGKDNDDNNDGKDTMTASMMMAVAAVFLPDRQQSIKRGSGRNGGKIGDGNGKGHGDGNRPQLERTTLIIARMMTNARITMAVVAAFLPVRQQSTK